jgi:hypothetical protein
LAPFVTSHFFQFSDAEKRWGAIVIPPTRNAPHVFMADIHKRYRGDVYVRGGTTTLKAQPEDYARFFRQHLEEHTFEFQRSISDLQRKVSTLEARLRKPSKNTAPQDGSPLLERTIARPSEIQSDVRLVQRINQLLVKEEDLVARGLLQEASKIMKLLQSLPWATQVLSKDATTEALTKIEEVSHEFWSATISLILQDEKGSYDEALLRAISHLAQTMEPPIGVSFTQLGRNLRYYPLVATLYLVCVLGVAKKRDRLIKRAFKLELQGRSHYDEPLPITYALFLIRQAAEFFQPLHEGYPQNRWCDPIATCVRTLIDRLLTEGASFLDKDVEFYKGEYVLCISPMDQVEKSTNKPLIGHPSSGLYLYMSEAAPIISRFLRRDKDWIQKLFERPLQEMLRQFDQVAHHLASPGCWTSGFAGRASEAAFPDKGAEA